VLFNAVSSIYRETHVLIRSIAALATALFLMASPTMAEEIAGHVVGVSDGDTLTMLTEAKKQVKVRLAEIDTPESGQPYGSRAKQALSDLVYRKAVRVVVQDTDRYGRTVGRVYVGTQDINAEMIRQGAAWVYRQYSRDPLLLPIEQEARNAKRGLWALPEAERTPPWEWRAAERSTPRKAAPSQPTASTATGFACEGKRTCGQMDSCAEARFYLNQCGVSRLDGDKDGTPCEKLCR
jgi:endonuclease YncB( thermonuclease family)